MSARVAIVLVSHSDRLARGAAELAAQMAPDVALVPAGGGPDGGLGTSVDRVAGCVRDALAAAGAAGAVVVVADLGSAILTVESVLELWEDELGDSVRLADAPFVEGAVAAAVAAQGGGDLAAVLAAAERAGSVFASPSPAVESAGAGAGAPAITRTVTVRNPLGLHARPAAVLARTVAGFDAALVVDGVDGASVLELMKLGATGGHELTLTASGPQAGQALDAVVGVVEGGFGEV